MQTLTRRRYAVRYVCCLVLCTLSSRRVCPLRKQKTHKSPFNYIPEKYFGGIMFSRAPPPPSPPPPPPRVWFLVSGPQLRNSSSNQLHTSYTYQTPIEDDPYCFWSWSDFWLGRNLGFSEKNRLSNFWFSMRFRTFWTLSKKFPIKIFFFARPPSWFFRKNSTFQIFVFYALQDILNTF